MSTQTVEAAEKRQLSPKEMPLPLGRSTRPSHHEAEVSQREEEDKTNQHEPEAEAKAEDADVDEVEEKINN